MSDTSCFTTRARAAGESSGAVIPTAVEQSFGQCRRRTLAVQRSHHRSGHSMADPEAAAGVTEEPTPATDGAIELAPDHAYRRCSRAGDQGVPIASWVPEWKIPSRSGSRMTGSKPSAARRPDTCSANSLVFSPANAMTAKDGDSTADLGTEVSLVNCLFRRLTHSGDRVGDPR